MMGMKMIRCLDLLIKSIEKVKVEFGIGLRITFFVLVSLCNFVGLLYLKLIQELNVAWWRLILRFLLFKQLCVLVLICFHDDLP